LPMHRIRTRLTATPHPLLSSLPHSAGSGGFNATGEVRNSGQAALCRAKLVVKAADLNHDSEREVASMQLPKIAPGESAAFDLPIAAPAQGARVCVCAWVCACVCCVCVYARVGYVGVDAM
jgi:hypothetical protein